MIVLKFIFLLIMKVLVYKLLKIFHNNLFILHSASIFLTILFSIIFFSVDLNFYEHLLIVVNLLLVSYIIINIPGAFSTSLRLKLLGKIYDSNLIYQKNLKKEFNDEKLFQDRFQRLLRYKILKKKKKNYFISDMKIIILSNFNDFLRDIFKKIKKY